MCSRGGAAAALSTRRQAPHGGLGLECGEELGPRGTGRLEGISSSSFRMSTAPQSGAAGCAWVSVRGGCESLLAVWTRSPAGPRPCAGPTLRSITLQQREALSLPAQLPEPGLLLGMDLPTLCGFGAGKASATVNPISTITESSSAQSGSGPKGLT